MEKIDIKDIITKLSEKRPVFHSEADFQHELAWLLHKNFPKANIRLEKPYIKENGKSEYIDIFADLEGKKYFIELKYKTKKLEPEKEINGEKFILKNQGAQDCGRWDFWKDVSRIENKIDIDNGCFGWVIFLTNDHSYLKSPGENTYSYKFRINDERDISAGNVGPLKGYTKGREEEIILKNSYRLEWRDYGDYGFRYLLLEIRKKNKMTHNQFKKLKKFKTVSFALWNSDSLKFRDTECIEENITNLHGRIIIVGLNPSKDIRFLENFHQGRYDRWYAEAFSKKPFCGAYMTDLISYPESDARKIILKWRRDKNFRKNNIKILKEQFDVLGVKDPIIVCIGANTHLLFREIENIHTQSSKIYYIRHPNSYRSRGRRKEFINDVKKIGRKIILKKENE